MRIIALVDADTDGALTDSSATVGEISLGGTASLLALGTAAGVLGGLLYLGLRRWLWVPQPWRGLAFGVVTLATIGQPVFDPANVDFQIFEPVLLVVLMFVALFLVNGLILARLMARIHPEPAYKPGKWLPAVASGGMGLVTAAGLVLIVGTTVTMIDDRGTCLSAAGGGTGCAVTEPR
jgi:hypothetical protein